MTLARNCARGGFSDSNLPRSIKFFPQPLPDFDVLMIEFGSLEREFSRPAHEPRLKHERQRVALKHGLQVCVAGFLECLCVRAVTGHTVVQARAAGYKALRLRIVLAV